MATIDPDVVQDMNDRKNKVAQLIADAKKDPMIDDDNTNKLFYLFSAEVDNYKYTGSNIELQKAMDSEIETNANGLKESLLGLSYLEIQIYEVILSRLI